MGAAELVVLARSFGVTATGGVQYGGEALANRLLAAAGTGGVVYGGEAVVGHTVELLGTGGVSYGGSALGSQSVGFLGTGGMQYGGDGLANRLQAFSATGGVLYDGTATVSRLVAFSATGGMQFAGDGIVSRTVLPVATGGAVYSGAGVVDRLRVFAATGGAQYGGDALVQRTRAFPVAETAALNEVWTRSATSRAVSRSWEDTLSGSEGVVLTVTTTPPVTPVVLNQWADNDNGQTGGNAWGGFTASTNCYSVLVQVYDDWGEIGSQTINTVPSGNYQTGDYMIGYLECRTFRFTPYSGTNGTGTAGTFKEATTCNNPWR
jgi:hypothetical protein